MKAYSIEPSDSICIIGFLATLKPEYDINNIYEKSAMWVSPFFVQNAWTTALKSCMFATTHIILVVASFEVTEMLTRKELLTSLPKLSVVFKEVSNQLSNR